jgi:16S rRNA (cytidine1402-2'-O)-methyltransferase
VLGPAEADGGTGDGGPVGLDQLRRLVEAGAKPRPAAAAVAELTGGSANALYRAFHE